jgi:CheY-like chemotaxis protein
MSAVVLNVEDSLDDIVLLKHACRRAETSFELRVAEDGEIATDYFLGRGEYSDRTKHPLPNLVLLDLNMPRKSGFEVLAMLKQSTELRNIPVAIFTSSTNEDDIRRAIGSGADCYLVKPLNHKALISLMQYLDGLLQGLEPISSALAKVPQYCAIREQTPGI